MRVSIGLMARKTGTCVDSVRQKKKIEDKLVEFERICWSAKNFWNVKKL
jgi:hypothetical protein